MLLRQCSSMKRRPRNRLSICITLALSFGTVLAGGPSRATKPAAGDLVSSTPFMAPETPGAEPDAVIKADATLLVYDMPSVQGGMTQASAILFIPKGTPPPGGWPVIAWAHGTTTPGQKTCAPSLSPDLDGGLTASGFVSNYVFLTAALVNAGYAVVSPDYEGLGAVASVPYPYYSASSLARSLVDGVRAAHHADTHLSSRWMAVGHSDGGHAVLGVESYAAEAPELAFQGAVAYAPYTSVAALVSTWSDMAASNPGKAQSYLIEQNFNVALMATGLAVQSPAFDVGSVMGNDLKQQMPAFKTKGSVGAIAGLTQAMAAKAPGTFSGFKPQWSTAPAMSAFLAANDPAVEPGFNLRLPTLIVQGTADDSVLEPLTAKFANKLIAAGDPVTYRIYPGANHFTVIRAATPDVLLFLANRFHSQKEHHQ